MPLADVMRPKTLDEICGQKHLFAKNAPLRRIIDSGNIPSMVFFGPPGTGKTTAADIIARLTGKQFFRLNATTSSVAEVKDALAASESLAAFNGTLIYIDEIQYFNKKQQQSLLEYMEDGRVTLICSTTENPYFALY
ncbi:MAG: AAA family ATPase, partial [Clostridia bacterium]|nr:AAA family ATPase [Clostridia bacterium]